MSKRIVRGTIMVLLVVGHVVAGVLYFFAWSFDKSVEKRYEIQLAGFTASRAPEVIARGQHLSSALGACPSCHGDDLGGKVGKARGPLGVPI